ncbi:VENN motif pre-toxin domain-containing protein [Moraxella oculi]|uniref:VENN motif pre-toxin domain-containing protein n=1 Tax=Moraxella oculi TaxID=2940516 RepID=UPI0024B3AECC|nr:VENN motif pre-toxin domain-containing protein [Moraxella sp. Tifton1]
MWGDYQVDDPNTLTQTQKDTLIHQAKLLAAITAAYADEDVGTAASMAEEAVRWNAITINKVKASVPKANQEEANKLVALLNAGTLTINKENLDYLYRVNTNENLTILVNADDVGKVLVTSSWKPTKDGSGNLRATVRPINLSKWAIFGTLTLVKRTDGTYGFYDDTYNFEMHHSLRPDELLRNANTKIGSPICGSLSGCTGFRISFNKTNYNPKNIIELKD